MPTTSGNVNAAASVVRVTNGQEAAADAVDVVDFPTATPPQVLRPTAQPLGDVFVAWNRTIDPSPVSGATTIDRYEVWATADDDTPFGRLVTTVAPGTPAPYFGGSPIAGFQPGMLWARLSAAEHQLGAGQSGYFAVRTVYADGTFSLFHDAFETQPGSEVTTETETTVDCRNNGSAINITARDGSVRSSV